MRQHEPEAVSSEIYRWVNGQCADFAFAMQDAAAEDQITLSIGRHLDGSGQTVHVFAHDDRFAFDAFGRHDLPYCPRPEWVAEHKVDAELLSAQFGPPDESAIAEAFELALEIWGSANLDD